MHLVGHPAPLLVGETVRLLSEGRVVAPLGAVTRTVWPGSAAELGGAPLVLAGHRGGAARGLGAAAAHRRAARRPGRSRSGAPRRAGAVRGGAAGGRTRTR